MALSLNIKARPPLVEGLLYAIFMVFVVLFVSQGSQPESLSGLLQKLCFVSGGVLVFMNVLDGVAFARRDATRWSPSGIMYAAALGMFYAWLMIVVMWAPQADINHADIFRHIFTWIAAGIFFGLFMNVMFKHEKVSLAREAYYDMDRAMTASTGVRIFLYYGAPILGILFLIGAMIDAPGQGWDMPYIWFMLVLLWTVAPLYSIRKGDWLGHATRIIGFALLIIGLFAF